MTITGALNTIRRVGAVEVSGGKLKLRFPESERAALQPAIDTLRSHKDEALRLLSEPPPPERWPESLLDMADEVAVLSSDIEAGRQVWTSWSEWKARCLNRLFHEQGVTGKPGCVTAATVRHGERSNRRSGAPAVIRHASGKMF
jgi:hypothetical protein